MELKLRISYTELFELIRQLPPSQMLQLKSELAGDTISQPEIRDKKAFKTLLLEGPVMSKEQYQEFLQTRNWISYPK